MNSASSSIAGRLTTWFFVSCCILIISGTGGLYWSLVEITEREDNSILAERMKTLQSILLRRENALDAAKRRIESEWTQVSPDKVYVRLESPDGEVISVSPGTPTEVVAKIFDAHPNAPTRLNLNPDLKLLATSSILQLVSKNAAQKSLIATIAIDLSSEYSILEKFKIRLVFILFTELIVAFILGRKLAVYSLAPVKKIAARAANIGPTNLFERIDEKDLPEELKLLVSTFNEMLDRLSESFNRLTRFSSDISHELRTPINNIRGELEISLGRERTPGEYQDIIVSSIEEIDRITEIIEALLFLATSENPQTELERQTYNLKEELSKLIDFYEPNTTEAKIDINLQVNEDEKVDVNLILFQRAIGNLITNGISYTPAGGKITILSENANTQISNRFLKLKIMDTGIGISPDQIKHVFDRFYRADPSRTNAPLSGSGLGLSIVKAIVHLHGGEIEVTSQPGKGTCVELQIPKSNSTPLERSDS